MTDQQQQPGPTVVIDAAYSDEEIEAIRNRAHYREQNERAFQEADMAMDKHWKNHKQQVERWKTDGIKKSISAGIERILERERKLRAEKYTHRRRDGLGTLAGPQRSGRKRGGTKPGKRSGPAESLPPSGQEDDQSDRLDIRPVEDWEDDFC